MAKNETEFTLDESAPEGMIYMLPKVYPVVYLPPGQREATFAQEMEAITEAYTQAAKRSEVGIIKNLG